MDASQTVWLPCDVTFSLPSRVISDVISLMKINNVNIQYKNVLEEPSLALFLHIHLFSFFIGVFLTTPFEKMVLAAAKY